MWKREMPAAMTASLGEYMRSSAWPKTTHAMPSVTPATVLHASPVLSMRRTRFTLPTPMFWLVNEMFA